MEVDVRNEPNFEISKFVNPEEPKDFEYKEKSKYSKPAGYS